MLKRRQILQLTSAVLGGVLIGSPTLRVMAGDSPRATASDPIFTPVQSQVISALAEMIIPVTDTPGAIEAGVPAFIEMMVTDWYTDTEREIFLDGLSNLDQFCHECSGTDFLGASEQVRIAALTDAEKKGARYASQLPGGILASMSKEFDEHIPFFQKLKELTVIGYLSSEIGAKQEFIYSPMPMRYDGDYDFARAGRQWSF